MILRALVALALAGFLSLTGIVLLRYGYLGFFEIATANAAVGQLFLDLVIALVLLAVWIHRDARRHGVSPWPWIAIGGVFGVAGPLGYLLRRPRQPRPDARESPGLPVAAPVAAALLVALAAFTLFALDRHGYMGILFVAGANEATQLLSVDVILSVGILAVLVVLDARARGASWAPFMPLAVLFGSAGPLLYLVTRGLPRAAQRAAGILGLVAFGFTLTLGTGHADLRTEAVRRAGPESAARGRERLERLAERHGLAAWRRHRTLETVGIDEWPAGGPWWPADDQRLRSQMLLGTFTSRVELRGGPAAGQVWGIQAWSAYRMESPSSAPVFLEGPERAITFYLPTLQYFIELPFRLLSADVVRDAGPGRYRGHDYDRVFVTWRRPEPRPDVDQYVLWIDRDTGLLAKVRYTVRDAVPMMPAGQRALALPLVAGTMHYGDYRAVDGVQVPFVQTVTLPPPPLTRLPLAEHFFHRLTLEEARFDAVDAAALVPEPARGSPADRKPSLD